MKKRLSVIFLALILIVFTISGYATKQDINDMAYVIAIGIDIRRNKRFKSKFSIFNSGKR